MKENKLDEKDGVRQIETFQQLKAKWIKNNSCKQYQETNECPHEGCIGEYEYYMLAKEVVA